MVKTCERCGAAYETHPGKVRYCRTCREELKADKVKNQGKSNIHNCDSPERIAICLSCKVPPNRCTGNCEKIRTTVPKYERKR